MQYDLFDTKSHAPVTSAPESAWEIMFSDRSNRAINRLLYEQAISCPDCNAESESLFLARDQRLIAPHFRVGCSSCGYVGAKGNNIDEALLKWGKTTFRLGDLYKKFKDEMKRENSWLGVKQHLYGA
jgi:hypothetical protein